MPTATPMEVDDAVVLLLGGPAATPATRGRIEGVTRLEKLVFLLERESPVGNYLTEELGFSSHNFGPFSAKVYQAVDTLAAAKLVVDSAKVSPTSEDAWEADQIIGADEDPYATRDFELTERGRRYYEALLSELPDGTSSELADFKRRFATLPLRQLIRYVYRKYPEFTNKSLIRDDILGY